MFCDQEDLEPHLLAVRHYLTFKGLDEIDQDLKKSVKKLAIGLLIWNNQLFRRTGLGTKIVLQRKNCMTILGMFCDQMGTAIGNRLNNSSVRDIGSHLWAPM